MNGLLINRLLPIALLVAKWDERLSAPINSSQQWRQNRQVDTFNHNAHTTASDPLWAELPV